MMRNLGEEFQERIYYNPLNFLFLGFTRLYSQFISLLTKLFDKLIFLANSALTIANSPRGYTMNSQPETHRRLDGSTYTVTSLSFLHFFFYSLLSSHILSFMVSRCSPYRQSLSDTRRIQVIHIQTVDW